MLHIRNLCKSFTGEGREVIHAVRDLSFSVQSGEVYGLLGPNGAGKTTTLRILSTLTTADSGRVTVGTTDRDRDPLGIRQQIAYVPAEAGLPERLTPIEVVTLFAQIQAVPQAKHKSHELLQQMGAGDYMHKPCGELSTGMKRRVVLARALIHEPNVLLLDEPTDGLDVSGRQDVLKMVRDQANNGRAIVLSSHIMGEVQQVADRIGILHRGQLAAEGTIQELLQQSDSDSLNQAFLSLTQNKP